MWVEPDMNLPSGESIVRQLIFDSATSSRGSGSAVLWCGFLTCSAIRDPAANLQNRAGVTVHHPEAELEQAKRLPPFDVLLGGVDGTRVLTHFPPVDTYNAEITPAEVRYAESNFKEHGWSNWSLMPFGHGNGGGGPTREMMERARRMADLDGVSPISVGTVEQFFGHVESEIDAGAPVPVWKGELYFEMHRGTLTSQSATKSGNRCANDCYARRNCGGSPQAARRRTSSPEIEALWKDVLLQQFHDIIPGSSIAWVAADAEAAHTRVAARLEAIIADALSVVAMPARSIANAASHARREVIVVDGNPTLVEVPGTGICELGSVSADDHPSSSPIIR